MEQLTLRDLVGQNTDTTCSLDICYLTAVSHDTKQKVIHHFFVATEEGNIIYAIELLVGTGYDPPHIYVSKVDTTGCHQSIKSPITGLTKAILEFVVRGSDMPTRLCLFARSQPQYIFPCSSQNKGKHITDDSSLLKWWTRIFEHIRVQFHDRQTLGYLVMPGTDVQQASRYLPDTKYWHVGHPYDPTVLASETIPKFPDDPKARLLADLKSDNQVNTTVEHFWELMNYRQEMCLGHAIAFVMLDVPAHEDPVKSVGTSGSPRRDSIDYKTYKRLFDSLQAATYSDVQETKLASEQWIALVKAHCPDTLHANIRGKAHKITRGAETPSSAMVNVLQPRKRKKDSSDSTTSAAPLDSRKRVSLAPPNGP